VLDAKGKLIHAIFRNDVDFPFLFVEDHSDGNDYLICAEDLQTHTVIRLNTGERLDYVSEKSKRNMEFSWQRFFVSPDMKKMAIEGTAKHKHNELVEYSEIRFYNFENPLILPYYEISDRITCPYENIEGWEEDNSSLLVSFLEERRKSDQKSFIDLTRKESMKALKNDDLQFRRVIYRFPIETGKCEEVYSEWVVK